LQSARHDVGQPRHGFTAGDDQAVLIGDFDVEQ
jgi:hypothetical protein